MIRLNALMIGLALAACAVEPTTSTTPDPVRCQLGSPGCPGGTTNDPATASASVANPKVHALDPSASVSPRDFGCTGTDDETCTAFVHTILGEITCACTSVILDDGSIDSVTCSVFWSSQRSTPALTNGGPVTTPTPESTTCVSDPVTGHPIGAIVGQCPPPDPYQAQEQSTIQSAETNNPNGTVNTDSVRCFTMFAGTGSTVCTVTISFFDLPLISWICTYTKDNPPIENCNPRAD